MKLETDSSEVATGNQQTGAFSINASGHAFKVLSEGLYTNKIRAVIREISCNAADAHKSVGSVRPIEVTLPTHSVPFKVQDFGPGLSHEDVMSLYTTYFRSTKSDDNTATGGFGLGSKSPFAYAPQFVVSSVFGGERRTYLASLAPNGSPHIAMTDGPTATDDHTGIAVSIDVKPMHFCTFTEEADNVFAAFEIPPVFADPQTIWRNLNSDKHNATPMHAGEGWSIYGLVNHYANRWLDTSRIRMGNVDYPIPADLDAPAGLNTVVGSYEDHYLILEVPIGALTPTPSREAISLTDEARVYLTARMQAVLKEITDKVTTSVDACTSLWEARFELQKQKDELSGSLQGLIRPTYRGDEVRLSFTPGKCFTSAELAVYRYHAPNYGGGGVLRQNEMELRYTPGEDDVVIMGKPDQLQQFDKPIRLWALGQPQRMRNITFHPKTQAARDKLMKILGIPEDKLMLAENLPKAPSLPRGVKAKNMYKARDGVTNEALVGCLDTGGLYVVKANKDWHLAPGVFVTANRNHSSRPTSLLEGINTIGSYCNQPDLDSTGLIVINAADEEKFKPLSNWKSLYTVGMEALAQAELDAVLVRRAATANNSALAGYLQKLGFWQAVSEAGGGITLIQEALREVEEQHPSTVPPAMEAATRALHALRCVLTPSRAVPTECSAALNLTKLAEVEKAFPILEMLRSQTYYSILSRNGGENAKIAAMYALKASIVCPTCADRHTLIDLGHRTDL